MIERFQAKLLLNLEEVPTVILNDLLYLVNKRTYSINTVHLEPVLAIQKAKNNTHANILFFLERESF